MELFREPTHVRPAIMICCAAWMKTATMVTSRPID